MFENKETRLKRKAISKKKKIIIYMATVILISFLLSLLLMFMANDAFSLTALPGKTEVRFAEDVGLFKASKALKEKGLIDSRLWFTLYSRLRGKGVTVKAGSYEIPNTGGYDGILSALSRK